MEKVKIGIIGCGNISDIYLENCKKFEGLKVSCCADLIVEKAQVKAKEHKVPKACKVEELLSSPDVDIVLNITNPVAHKEICLKAIDSGKSVFVEKPLGITREEGKKILEKAKEKGVRVGAAPDTFLGGGLQLCRKLIDDGWIGKPVAATAFMAHHGHEGWHPDPEFTYKKGAGPMLGMGPYYMTTLIALLGSVKSTIASAKMSFPERTIMSMPKRGQKIKVEVPTHVTGVLEFENGILATTITSYDVWASNLPWIEIYGSEGTLSVPDPNTFGGPVKVFRVEENKWSEMPIPFVYKENSRGLGLADMAYAIKQDRNHRANGELAYHALDVMLSFYNASDKEQKYVVESSCARPEPLSSNLVEWGEIT
jgi:predicted dehydrogenase